MEEPDDSLDSLTGQYTSLDAATGVLFAALIILWIVAYAIVAFSAWLGPL